MILTCELDSCQHQVNALVCVYSCPRATKLKCATYDKNYERIKAMLVEQKYLTKYGLPDFPEPRSRKKKKDKVVKPVKQVTEATPAESVKPKRKRRTKAEMEEAKKAGEK